MPPISRRTILTLAGASSFLPVISKAAHIKHWSLGVQLWSVNAEMKADPDQTLRSLYSLGYRTVESADLYGLSPAQFRANLDRSGLKCISAHASMGDLDQADAQIDKALTLGAKWLVCSSPRPSAPLDSSQPWLLAMSQAMTLDDWKRNSERLAELAPLVKKAGLQLAYHNHTMEFTDHSGIRGYDLINGASGDLRLEVDIGWVFASGQDPVDFIRTYNRRIDLLHVKDMTKAPSEPLGVRSMAVGEGLIRWPEVFAEARKSGVSGYFVEQEAPYTRPILGSLATSADYLKRHRL